MACGRQVLEESIQTVQQAGDLELRRGLPLALSSVFLPRSSHAEDERAAVVKRATSLYQSLVTPAVITRAVDKVYQCVLQRTAYIQCIHTHHRVWCVEQYIMC